MSSLGSERILDSEEREREYHKKMGRDKGSIYVSVIKEAQQRGEKQSDACLAWAHQAWLLRESKGERGRNKGAECVSGTKRCNSVRGRCDMVLRHSCQRCRARRSSYMSRFERDSRKKSRDSGGECVNEMKQGQQMGSGPSSLTALQYRLTYMSGSKTKGHEINARCDRGLKCVFRCKQIHEMSATTG